MIKVDYNGCFGDKRLDNRGLELQEGIFRNSVHSIQQIAQTRAEQKAYYRFLKNEKVSEDKLVKELSDRCGKLAKDKIVLSIQDTTEINLFSHRNRIDKESGVGDIGDSILGIGFMLHPSLVINAETCFPLGFSHVKVWNRAADSANKNDRNYKKLAIEDKESYKWIESSDKTKKALSEAKAVIIIQDREGDIFEQFARIPDQKTFLLIRSRTDRKLESNEQLWARLSQAAVLGQYKLDIAADHRRKTPARKATIEVRSVAVKVKPPVAYKGKDADWVSLHAIEAKEVNDSIEEPVHWRLVTTWPISSFDDCVCAIEWYTWRWQIEEVFRTLKKERYDIESSELECGWAIRKLAIIMMDVIVKLMQMRIAYSYPEGESPSTDTVFNEAEQQCLKELTKKMEGKTMKLQNPYPPDHLKWAVWTIARLGGWKGYKSQRPPGLTTFQEGLDKFYSVFSGWTLQKDVGTP
jgi:transposase-like protein